MPSDEPTVSIFPQKVETRLSVLFFAHFLFSFIGTLYRSYRRIWSDFELLLFIVDVLYALLATAIYSAVAVLSWRLISGGRRFGVTDAFFLATSILSPFAIDAVFDVMNLQPRFLRIR